MSYLNKLKSKLLGGNVSKNVGWILLQNIFTMFLGLILTGIVARHYGTSGYGIINFASSFVSLFSCIAIFGTNNIIINDLSEEKYSKGIVLGSNLFIRLILSIISLIISQVVALLIYDAPSNIAILLFNINVIINCNDIISYYAQSKVENKYISISKMISTVFFSIAKIIVIVLNLNIYYYIFTYLIENIIYTILLICSYKKIKNNAVIEWKIDKNYIIQLLKRSKYYAFSSLMVTIYLRIDQVMLGSIFTSKSVVGIYSAAVRISDIWTFVPLSIITSFKPIIIKNKESNDKNYMLNMQKLYNIVSFVCFIFILGIIIFGKLGIFILYGEKFKDAYIPLVILAFGIWIGVLGNIHYIWMTCEGKEKYSILYSCIGSVTNIILNLILIPRIGIIGAALATLISQISSNILAFLLLKNARILSFMLLKSLNPYLGIKELFKKKDNEIMKKS